MAEKKIIPVFSDQDKEKAKQKCHKIQIKMLQNF